MRLFRFVLSFFLLFSFCGVFAQQSGSGQDMTFAQFKEELASQKDGVIQPFLAQIKDFSAEQQASFLSRANAAWDRAIEELWAARSSSTSQEELDRKAEKIDEKLMRSLNAAVFSLQIPALKDAYGEEAEREAQALLGRLEAGSVTTAQFQTQWQELLDKNFLKKIRQAYGAEAEREMRALLAQRNSGAISAEQFQTQQKNLLNSYQNRQQESWLSQIRQAYGAEAEREMRALLAQRSSGAISEAQYQRKSNEILQRYGAQQMSQTLANLHSLLEEEKLQVRKEYFNNLPANIDAKYQRQLNQIYTDKEQAYVQLYKDGLSPEVVAQRAQDIEADYEKKLSALYQSLCEELGPAECRRRDLQRRAGKR